MRTGNNNLTNRKLLVMGIFIAIGVIYLIKLFSLQVLDKQYKQLADNNALRFVTQYPARGKVYDRNGKLLVFNEAVSQLFRVLPPTAEFLKSAEFTRLRIREERTLACLRLLGLLEGKQGEDTLVLRALDSPAAANQLMLPRTKTAC